MKKRKDDPHFQPINWETSFTWEPDTKKYEGSITFEPVQVLKHIMIATVTPTRGDRKVLYDFSKKQVNRQTWKPDKVYNVDYQPSTSVADLTQRVKAAWLEAKKDQVDILFIIEDDDFYPDNYIETVLDSWKEGEVMPDFFGYTNTIYYHIGNRTWKNQSHPGRSSLFCTALRVEALNDFIWPADHNLWLDIAIWEFARDKRKNVRLMDNNPCIGIKHSIGKCAGKAHKWVMENRDPDLSFLRSKVGDFHFDFYSKLKL